MSWNKPNISKEKRLRIQYFIRYEMNDKIKTFPTTQIRYAKYVSEKFDCKPRDVILAIWDDLELNQLVKERTTWKKKKVLRDPKLKAIGIRKKVLQRSEIKIIRELRRLGVSNKDLAKEFGVCSNTIRDKVRDIPGAIKHSITNHKST